MAGSYKGKEDWESMLGQPTCSIFYKAECDKVKNNKYPL